MACFTPTTLCGHSMPGGREGWEAAWVTAREGSDAYPVIEFREIETAAGRSGVQLWRQGVPLAAPLFDHPGVAEGYRFVDVFHFAHAVVLDRSPNTDLLLAGGRQARELPSEVGVEDAISVLTLTHATLAGPALVAADILDPELVASVMHLAARGAPRFAAQRWEAAVACGIRAWRQVLSCKWRCIELDFAGHTLRPR